MPISRLSAFSLYLVLLVLLSSFSPAAELSEKERRDLINEENWPPFVQSRIEKVTPDDDNVTRLLKERCNAGQRELRNRYIYWLQGADTLPQVCEVAQRVILARTELGGPGSEKAALLEEKLAFAKTVEKQAKLLEEKVRRAENYSAADTATYFRITAELELLRAKKAKADADK